MLLMDGLWNCIVSIHKIVSLATMSFGSGTIPIMFWQSLSTRNALNKITDNIGSACGKLPTSLKGLPPSVPRIPATRLPSPMCPTVPGGRGMGDNGF